MFDKNGVEMKVADVVGMVMYQGKPEFFLKLTDPDTEYSVAFDIYEANGWEWNESTGDFDIPNCETTPYLRGTIKWDGCSHIWFGDDDKYTHLFGEGNWESHIRLMQELIAYAKKTIKHYNNDVAGD